MDNKFKDDERLLRAVRPNDKRFKFWKDNGKLSSAAFKDKKGLSVDRTYDRSMAESIIFIKQNLSGNIVSVSVSDCNEIETCLKYLPSEYNKYHSEIHGSENEIILSDIQAFQLARKARLEE